MAHLLEGKRNHRSGESGNRQGSEERRIRFHARMEEWTKKDIIVKSDPLLHEEHFDIF